ncbi:hypothetical protein Ahy_A01g003717 [Arachis hypogaea]|uniref:GRF-type domain-containing protein n=1 Tax=Arachis hypogaea TaxID=3818 RepID=A0A445ETM6_ARAHY|nr:hypothetical protein Ahy_A01g003717 [Arachis hypogaea]
MSLRRLKSTANRGSHSSSASSKKMKEKKLHDKCFCGRELALMESDTIMNPNRWFIRCPLWAIRDKRYCKYFVWVDEPEEGWEGLARCLVKRKSEHSYARHDNGLTVTAVEKNQQASSVMARKIEKFNVEIRGEIRRIRVLLSTVALRVAFCLFCELYLVMKL